MNIYSGIHSRSPSEPSINKPSTALQTGPISGGDTLRETSLSSAEDTTRSPAPRPVTIFKPEAARKIGEISSRVHQSFPDLQKTARETASEIVLELTGKHADPDKLYLHGFSSASTSHTSFTGWEHHDAPTFSATLTEMVLRNFDSRRQELQSIDFNVNMGVYTDGRDGDFYGAGNDFPLPVSAFRDAVWAKDMQAVFSRKLEQFWSSHEDDVRLLSKAQFLIEIDAAKNAGRISDGAYRAILSSTAPEVLDGEELSSAELAATHRPSPEAPALRFDVNGYTSSDMVRFKTPEGGIVLYSPGEHPALQQFETEAKERDWVLAQARSESGLPALERHFSLYNRQDGITYTGANNGLKKLAAGTWTSGINIKNEHIQQDIFADMVQQMRDRSLSDANTLIKSDSEVTRDMWLDDVKAFNSVFWPILMVVPGGPVTLTTSMVGELGLEADKATNGDTYDERSAGAKQAMSTAGTIFLGAALGKFQKSLAIDEAGFSARPSEPTSDTPGIAKVTSSPPIADMAAYAVPDATVANGKMSAAGIYQVGDRFFIRASDSGNTPQTYEVRSDFRFRDHYVNVIDPQSRRAVAIMHSDGKGGWLRVPGDGGGVDRPPYRAVNAEDIKLALNAQGYLVETESSWRKASFNTIEQMKERVDRVRLKFEDLGREAEQGGRIGDYHLVYRVDNVSPERILADGYFRPSRRFFAQPNMLRAPATIGSASLNGNNNVLRWWSAGDWYEGESYQYAIVTEGERVASVLDGGESEEDDFDEVHFPPPRAQNVYLLDSSDEEIRRIISTLAASRSVNTSYGVPLQTYVDYKAGTLELDDVVASPPSTTLSGTAPTEHASETVDSLSISRPRVQNWVDSSPFEKAPDDPDLVPPEHDAPSPDSASSHPHIAEIEQAVPAWEYFNPPEKKNGGDNVQPGPSQR